MEQTYQKNGDYYIPELTVGEIPVGKLGKFGQMRKRYLKEERNGMYTGLLLEGSLTRHLLEIQETAEKRMEEITIRMIEEQGITEDRKETDPIGWTQVMNSIRSAAEETVLTELIYQ